MDDCKVRSRQSTTPRRGAEIQTPIPRYAIEPGALLPRRRRRGLGPLAQAPSRSASRALRHPRQPHGVAGR